MSFACVVSKVHITRSTHAITHFSLQQKVPLKKVISTVHLLFVMLHYYDSFYACIVYSVALCVQLSVVCCTRLSY